MSNRSLLVIFLFMSFAIGIFGQDLEKDYTFSNNKLDSAFFYHKKQLEIAQKEKGSAHLGLRHWELGDFYFKVGVFSEAMEQFNLALNNLKNERDTLQVVIKNSIGLAELSLKNYAQAEVYFREAIKESIHLNYKRGQAISKSFLGTCFEKEGKYENALKYQNESLALFKVIGDSKGLSLVNENLGSIYEDLGDYDLAFEYFKMAHAFIAGESTVNEVTIINNLGDTKRKKKNYQEALFYTNKALSIAKELGDKHQLSSAHKDLSKTYVFLGDFQKAFTHLRESERLNEEWFYAQNTDQFNVLQTVYETDKKEAKIKLLVQESRLNKIRQNLLSILLVTGVLFLSVVYLYLRKRRKAKLRIQEYEKRLLTTELEKKAIEEDNLQNQIQLKTAALTKYSLRLSKKNKVLSGLSTTLKNIANRKNMDVSEKLQVLAKDIDHNLKYEKEWSEFINYFSDIHPSFIKKLSAYPEEKLSPAELRLGMLLRLNLSSKEIASVLRVTPDSIRVARHRLRKKLGIGQKAELVHFLLDL